MEKKMHKMLAYPKTAKTASYIEPVSKRLITGINARNATVMDYSKYGNSISQFLAKELLTGLLEESGKLIDKYYGLTSDKPKNLRVAWRHFEDDLTMGMASWDISEPNLLLMELSVDYFNSKTELTQEEIYSLRGTILHELTHNFQYISNPGTLNVIVKNLKTGEEMGEFLAEGMAEFMASGNWRLYTYLPVIENENKNPDSYAQYLISKIGNAIDKNPETMYSDENEAQEYYIGGYLACRYLHQVIREAGYSLGIKAFIQGLQATPPRADWTLSETDFNNVLKTVTNGKFESIDAFINHLLTATASNDGADFYNMVKTVVQEDPTVDGGMICGAVSGNAPITRIALLDSLITGNYKANPLFDFGVVNGTTIFGQTPDPAPAPDEGDEGEQGGEQGNPDEGGEGGDSGNEGGEQGSGEQGGGDGEGGEGGDSGDSGNPDDTDPEEPAKRSGKLPKKMIEILSVLHLADGDTRKALTNEDEEIDGLKIFTDNISVKKDVNKSSNSLITLADAHAMINALPTISQDIITLTQDMLNTRTVSLSAVAAKGSEYQAIINTEGGQVAYGGAEFDEMGVVDFILDGTTLTWRDTPIFANFMVGDDLVVKYYVQGDTDDVTEDESNG